MCLAASTVRPTRDVSSPCRLWANPRLGWNCLALPPRVGRPRAPLPDEPRSRDARQRPLLLFFRVDDFGTALARAGALVARLEEEPHVNPNTGTEEFSLRDPDGYYVTISSLTSLELSGI